MFACACVYACVRGVSPALEGMSGGSGSSGSSGAMMKGVVTRTEKSRRLMKVMNEKNGPIVRMHGMAFVLSHTPQTHHIHIRHSHTISLAYEG
jgi:hypothetical protein